MKLEVLGWIKDFLTDLFTKSLEILLRIILFFLPLGFYMCLLQFRSKVSSVRNISTFTTDNSTWQHIFPGFILVAVDSKLFKTAIQKKKNEFQSWISSNKYLLCFLICLFMVIFMVLYGYRSKLF